MIIFYCRFNGGREVEVAERVPHPKYTSYPVAQYDIAILKVLLKGVFTFFEHMLNPPVSKILFEPSVQTPGPKTC